MGIFSSNKTPETPKVVIGKNSLDLTKLSNCGKEMTLGNEYNAFRDELAFIKQHINDPKTQKNLINIIKDTLEEHFIKEGKINNDIDSVETIVMYASSAYRDIEPLSKPTCFKKFIVPDVQQKYIEETIQSLRNDEKRGPREYLEKFLGYLAIVHQVQPGDLNEVREKYCEKITRLIENGNESDIHYLFYNRVAGNNHDLFKLIHKELFFDAVSSGVEKYCKKHPNEINKINNLQYTFGEHTDLGYKMACIESVKRGIKRFQDDQKTVELE